MNNNSFKRNSKPSAHDLGFILSSNVDISNNKCSVKVKGNQGGEPFEMHQFCYTKPSAIESLASLTLAASFGNITPENNVSSPPTSTAAAGVPRMASASSTRRRLCSGTLILLT